MNNIQQILKLIVSSVGKEEDATKIKVEVSYDGELDMILKAATVGLNSFFMNLCEDDEDLVTIEQKSFFLLTILYMLQHKLAQSLINSLLEKYGPSSIFEIMSAFDRASDDAGKQPPPFSDMRH